MNQKRRTRGEFEAEVTKAMVRFEREQLGPRAIGPTHVHAGRPRADPPARDADSGRGEA